jgi:hypothetical protein
MTGAEIVRNLLGGVSQQPEDLRAPNQAKEAKNIVFDPVEGASKRYPSNHVASIDTVRQNQKHLFTMDRDDEQYLIWAGDSECDVYTNEGVQVPVVDSTNSGVGYVPLASTLTYLNGNRDTLRSQVIVDSAFIVNTTTEVVSGTYDANTPTWRIVGDRGQDCFANVFVRQFNWSSMVTVRWKVEGYDLQEVTYSTPANKTENAGSFGAWDVPTSSCETKNETSPYSTDIPTGSARAGWKVEWGSFSANTKEPGTTPVCDAPEQLYAHTSGATPQSTATYKHGDFEYDVATRIARLKPGIVDPATPLNFGWNQVHDPDFPDVRKRRDAGLTGAYTTVSRSFAVRADYVAEYLKEKIMAIASNVSGIEASYPAVEDSTGSGWFMLQTRPLLGVAKPFEVFEVTDNVDNTYVLGWTTEVEEISDLPLVCRNGAIARVVSGESDSEYYVAFRTEQFVRDDYTIENQWAAYDHVGKGNWVEFTPGQKYPRHDSAERKDALSKFTMPHIIKRITVTAAMMGNTTFTTNWPDAVENDICFDVRPYDSWDPRLVGDDDNNEAPSFVDNTISDIFFWQGRLGFLSNDNIILSEAGNPDNFWRTTQLSVPDNDRIDVTSTENQGKSLRYAVPLDERLMVFSDDTQIVLTSNGILSPSTVEAPVASNYEGLKNAPPILFGKSVLFPYKNHGYVGLRELIPLDRRENFASMELTSHLTRWIDVGTSHKVVASTSENMLFAHTNTNPDQLYVLRYVKGAQGEYRMTAWSNWDLPMDILDFTLLDDALYLILDNRNGETAIERIDLGSGQDDSATSEKAWLTHIDRKFYWDGSNAAVTANHSSGVTTFTFSVADGMYIANLEAGLKAYTVDGEILDDSGHGYSAAHYRVNGNYVGQPLWFGVPYDMRWKANRIYPRVPASGGSSPRTSRRTINNSLQIAFDRTGYFKTTVTYHTGSTFVTEYAGNNSNNRSGSSMTEYDDTEKIRSGILPVGIHGANYNVSILISTFSPLPCNLTTIELSSTQNPKHSLRGVW